MRSVVKKQFAIGECLIAKIRINSIRLPVSPLWHGETFIGMAELISPP